MSDDSTGRLWVALTGNIQNAGGAPSDSLWLDILVIFLLILVNAFFAASEIAIVTLNDNKIRKMSESGNKKASTILSFIENPGSFLATIQVGVTFAGFLSSAFAADKFADRIFLAVDPTGTSALLRNISVIGITIVLAFFNLVLGELVPKRIAQRYPEKVSFGVTGIIQGVGIFLKPFVLLLTWSMNGILRLLGIDPKAKEKGVTEEEILMMVDVGSENGSIQDGEREMIENIFAFNDVEVSEIMTHRTKIVSVDEDASYKEVMDIATGEKYTRIPVYRETIDNIVGLLHIKDLLLFSATHTSEDSFSITEIMRPAMMVPETKKLSSLFTQMQKERTQMAVVLDE